MMEKLIKKAEEKAAAKVRKTAAATEASLREEIPDYISVKSGGDAVIIEGQNLDQQIIDNSSIRDVAFLLRGVR